MHGGKRENAGRKAILESEKKTGYQVYLTPVQKQQIEEFGIGNSFSEKCVSLISKQLEVETVKAKPVTKIAMIIKSNIHAEMRLKRVGFCKS